MTITTEITQDLESGRGFGRCGQLPCSAVNKITDNADPVTEFYLPRGATLPNYRREPLVRQTNKRALDGSLHSYCECNEVGRSITIDISPDGSWLAEEQYQTLRGMALERCKVWTFCWQHAEDCPVEQFQVIFDHTSGFALEFEPVDGLLKRDWKLWQGEIKLTVVKEC